MNNFESNILGLTGYDITQTNATSTISSTQAHSGTYSLKNDVTVNDGFSAISLYGAANFSDSIYVRFWILFDSTFIANMDVNADSMDVFHFTDSGYGVVWYVGIDYDGADIEFWIDTDDGSDYDMGTVVADTWYCVEVYCDQDAANGTITCWINGVQEYTSSTVATGDAGWYFRIGSANWSTADVTGAFYIDDIVVDTKYIGTGYRIQEGVAVGSCPYF